ncbi:hypothetical protein T484DRAFT_1955335 [Baffinella frigidus]|nr:hypothetical protein T484DRAFT_1955335 [Cryptophyta sp. CCMP2293]
MRHSAGPTSAGPQEHMKRINSHGPGEDRSPERRARPASARPQEQMKNIISHPQSGRPETARARTSKAHLDPPVSLYAGFEEGRDTGTPRGTRHVSTRPQDQMTHIINQEPDLRPPTGTFRPSNSAKGLGAFRPSSAQVASIDNFGIVNARAPCRKVGVPHTEDHIQVGMVGGGKEDHHGRKWRRAIAVGSNLTPGRMCHPTEGAHTERRALHAVESATPDHLFGASERPEQTGAEEQAAHPGTASSQRSHTHHAVEDRKLKGRDGTGINDFLVGAGPAVAPWSTRKPFPGRALPSDSHEMPATLVVDGFGNTSWHSPDRKKKYPAAPAPPLPVPTTPERPRTGRKTIQGASSQVIFAHSAKPEPMPMAALLSPARFEQMSMSAHESRRANSRYSHGGGPTGSQPPWGIS